MLPVGFIGSEAPHIHTTNNTLSFPSLCPPWRRLSQSTVSAVPMSKKFGGEEGGGEEGCCFYSCFIPGGRVKIGVREQFLMDKCQKYVVKHITATYAERKNLVLLCNLTIKDSKYGKSKRSNYREYGEMQGLQPVCCGLPDAYSRTSAERGQRPRLSLRLYGKSGKLHWMHLMRMGMSRRLHRSLPRKGRGISNPRSADCGVTPAARTTNPKLTPGAAQAHVLSP